MTKTYRSEALAAIHETDLFFGHVEKGRAQRRASSEDEEEGFAWHLIIVSVAVALASNFKQGWTKGPPQDKNKWLFQEDPLLHPLTESRQDMYIECCFKEGRTRQRTLPSWKEVVDLAFSAMAEASSKKTK